MQEAHWDFGREEFKWRPGFLIQPSLQKKQLQAAESYSRQVVKTDQERLLRRYFKLMCYVLNRNFGFGSKRCLAVINGISRLSAEHDQDEIFWEHLDRVIVDEMKLDFERD